jgi:hypothetical protein
MAADIGKPAVTFSTGRAHAFSRAASASLAIGQRMVCFWRAAHQRASLRTRNLRKSVPPWRSREGAKIRGLILGPKTYINAPRAHNKMTFEIGRV